MVVGVGPILDRRTTEERTMPISRREREALEAMLAEIEHDLTVWTTDFHRRLRDVSLRLNAEESAPAVDPNCRTTMVD